jgi:hypothetical protein
MAFCAVLTSLVCLPFASPHRDVGLCHGSPPLPLDKECLNSDHRLTDPFSKEHRPTPPLSVPHVPRVTQCRPLDNLFCSDWVRAYKPPPLPVPRVRAPAAPLVRTVSATISRPLFLP